MNLFQKIFNGVILGVVIILLFLVAAPKGNAPVVGGGDYNNTAQYFYDGLYAGTSNQFSVNGSGDVVVGGGTLNVTTSNTATSTIIGGCFQFTATSTATWQKFQASTTPGIMYSSYGTCPNL